MRTRSVIFALVITSASFTLLPAQGHFQLITREKFAAALPKEFYLEGNAIPTESRNAALVKISTGAPLIFGLLDTTGYCSQVQQKYLGMIISEGTASVCEIPVPVGSYGFGLEKPKPGSETHAVFNLYNQAGAKIAFCNAKRDASLKQPKPLEIVLRKDRSARLYLGRYWLELR
jgi:hypothetical protein